MTQMAAGLAALAAAQARGAAAQGAGAFPWRPIRVTVPFAAGSATDIMMRHLAPHMQETLGQPLAVENRPGAAGVPGSETVVRAPADGHSLLMAAVSSHAIAPVIRRETPYDVMRDFTPIGLSCTSPDRGGDLGRLLFRIGCGDWSRSGSARPGTGR
jgi:tripartite-type tricarboxylate transporter receptor subunit TctC